MKLLTSRPDKHGGFFRHLIKSYLSSVPLCTIAYWTSHVFKGSRNTRQCLNGRTVCKICTKGSGRGSQTDLDRFIAQIITRNKLKTHIADKINLKSFGINPLFYCIQFWTSYRSKKELFPYSLNILYDLFFFSSFFFTPELFLNNSYIEK